MATMNIGGYNEREIQRTAVKPRTPLLTPNNDVRVGDKGLCTDVDFSPGC